MNLRETMIFNAELDQYGTFDNLESHLRYLRTYGGTPDMHDCFPSYMKALNAAKQQPFECVLVDSDFAIVGRVKDGKKIPH